MELVEPSLAARCLDRKVLQLPDPIRQGLGAEAIRVEIGAGVPILGTILQELAAEPCGHSWRNVLSGMGPAKPGQLVAAVRAHEASCRPATLFTYHGVGGALDGQVLAMGTVSSRVRRDFPHDGFPVIARCYIRQPYRGRGLYPVLLSHRLELCREHWGDRLKAVHLGAADETVHVAVGAAREGGLRFVHVGNEWLPVAGERVRVRDYLALAPAFRDAVQAGLGSELASSLASWLDPESSRVSFRDISCATRSEERLPVALQELMALCRAIGVQEE